MAHFSNFIQKCQFEGCRYHDFLPHKCEYCELMFCELHKKAQDHVCSKLKHSDLKKVILCEYCNAVIPDEEEEIKWHLIHKCTYIKKATKPKICDKEKCKTVLNDINSYFCKQCKKTFCLPHRYDFAHKCISDNKYKKGFFENIFKKEEHKSDKSYKKNNRKMKKKWCAIQ